MQDQKEAYQIVDIGELLADIDIDMNFEYLNHPYFMYFNNMTLVQMGGFYRGKGAL